MNILQQKQTQENQETICKIHNLELIAVDLDLSDKAQIQFYCGKCLVEKMKNNKVTTIEQSKERIQKIKAQQLDIKTKENQARLNYYKNILDQIMDFKQSINDSLEKMYKQIQQYIFPIQKEKLELQNYEQQYNYFEDIKQLSELYTQDEQKSSKLLEDNNFINEIQRQFEQLFNNSEYTQTLDTFKNTKQQIKDIMEINVIELLPLLMTQNESKTPSLSRICSHHKKEIIMIDMDTQEKDIEKRLACVDCISENPLIKYSTIENVNKQWKEYSSESEKILKEYKKESKEKKAELFNQIGQMRKNYNQKLNEICEKLFTDQYLCIDKTKESNQIKKISIQALDDQQLLKDLKQLIEKENVTSNQAATNLKSKDSIFKKEIENHLESLKQYDQQDIQQSLDILRGISIERNFIIQLSDTISQIQKSAQKDENYKDQINLIQEIELMIDQAKKYQSQFNLFDQTIQLYQKHAQIIKQIQSNIQSKTTDQTDKSEQLIKSQYQNLQNIINDYENNFENNSKQLKKFCNIQQLENDLVNYKEKNYNLELENTKQLNQKKKEFEEIITELNKKLELKEIEYQNLKNQFDQVNQDNINLKKQFEQDKINLLKEQQDQQNKLQQSFNQKMVQKDSELKTVQTKLDEINKKLEKDKMELEKNLQFQKGLTFSYNYKHNDIVISDNGKIVDIGNNSNGYCMCEKVIPKIGKIHFEFEILRITQWCEIGIGFREMIKQNGYKGDGQGQGSYLLREQSSTYFHHSNNTKGKAFNFQVNDIIIMEVSVEHKYIKWTKYNSQDILITEIDTSQDLYPCVYIKNSKVKIKDISS
ncbi:unnamed protein product [Paramecium pentaurelia]|uniref:Uncharacterized protein n=1 Tax=Paramecium pentaurelia TaxID=43138 RepID=A0A8S1T4G9_9CILI|nr:unnamed protein product [Paramecium pentaurelia]